MVYIESFVYYIAVVLFMFVVIFGSIVLLYMLFGQIKLFWANEDLTLKREKEFLYKLIKNRFFKLTLLAYFATFAFFYVNQSINYFSNDRAYPKAKAYAIVANTVFLWQSIGVNIKINRGFGSYYRLVQPENDLDNKIQKIQTFLLNKIYQFIPKEDGEREFWYYRYKQLYVAKIRYKPGNIHNPHPRFTKIMDEMYDTSYKLFNKPIKDRIIDKQRYLPIAQMSYYLKSNMSYYATYVKLKNLDKLFEFLDNKTLFQINIDYMNLLDKVYKKIQTDKKVAKEFNDNPYSFGLLYSSLLYGVGHNIIHNSHNEINLCISKEIKAFVNLVEKFYSWVFRDINSSFHKLSQKEQRQIKQLYFFNAISINYGVATYLCDIPIKYKDDRRLFKYMDTKILPIYKNNEEFLDIAVTMNDFVAYAKLEKLLNKKNQKNSTKDK